MAERRKVPSNLTFIAAVVIGVIIWFLVWRGLADLSQGVLSELADVFSALRRLVRWGR